jgi:hypothetical protein
VEGLNRLACGDDAVDLIIVDAVNGCRIRRHVASLAVPILLLLIALAILASRLRRRA